MKKLFIIVIIAAAAYYYFNSYHPSCENLEDVENRGIELLEKFQKAVFSSHKDIDAMKLIEKMKEVELMKKHGFPDVQAACNLMDDLMDEL
jgi:hypothetical protein